MCRVGVLAMYKFASHHGEGVSCTAFLHDESTVILCVMEARDKKGVQKFPSMSHSINIYCLKI
jgi:hypothetical protein